MIDLTKLKNSFEELKKAANDEGFLKWKSEYAMSMGSGIREDADSFTDWCLQRYIEAVAPTIIKRPCPKCGESICALKFYERAERKSMPVIEMVGRDPLISWDLIEITEPSEEFSEFECPECSEILFTEEDAANKWLLDPTSIKMPQFTYKFYNVIRICREDIAAAFPDEPHLAEAAAYIDDSSVERIASKVGDSLMDAGDYHLAMEIGSRDYVEEAFEKNKAAIIEAVKEELTECPECESIPNNNQTTDIQAKELEHIHKYGMCSICTQEHVEILEVCPTCGMNPNDGQSEEQQKWELDYVHEHGQCSACDLEDSESRSVENAIKSTADPRELERQQEELDMKMDQADDDIKARDFEDEPPEEE